MEILLISLAVVVISILFYHLNKSSLPGPIGVPFLGYLPFLNPKTPYKTLTNLVKHYGPIYQLKLGSVNTLVLADVSLVRDVLKREEFTARAPLALTHGIMGGYGLICAEGRLWKDQRKMSIEWLKQLGMVKFGASRDNLIKRIEIEVSVLVKTLRDMTLKATEVDPMEALHHTMGNILNDLVFGKKYSKDDKIWKYLQHLQEEGVKYIGVSGVVNFLPILRFLPQNKRIIKFLLDGKKETHKIYDEIIENCLKNIKINGTKHKDNTVGENINLEKSCILELFLKEKMSREENHDETASFYSSEQLRHLLADLFGAGVDTTLTTLRWFLLYMAKNENIQSILRQNLESLPKDDCLDLKQLENIAYLKACISETQRIRSVVPLGIPHGTVKDTIICDKYKIEKDTMIIPLQWAMHMNPDVWNEPEIFDPHRFLNDDQIYTTSQNFIPFQTGKRMCLGDELARMMLLMYAGSIIKNFQISLPADCEIDFEGNCGITLTPPKHSLIFKELN